MAQHSFILSSEVSEFAEDIREVFEELASTLPDGQRVYSGECHPPLDVFETDTTVEVVVDMAGVTPDAVRVVFRSGVLLIAGEKAPPATHGPLSYHLIEREFGRFARGVRLNGSFDVRRGTATIREGQLAIVLPKLPERRGQAHRITITTPAPDSTR